MSADRPLSGPQEIALARAASFADARRARIERGSLDEGIDWEWISAWHVGRTNTVEALARLGLVERRHRYLSLDYECRITEAGREMLASMGD